MSNTILSRQRRAAVTPVAASTTPATLTADANFTMPTTWVELTTSAGMPVAANGLWLAYLNTGIGPHRHRVNISKGATGGESIVVENLILTGLGNQGFNQFLPISVERGARLWIQACTSHTSATTAYANVSAQAEGVVAPKYPTRLYTYNADVATHAPAVFCDAGASANTKPTTFTELVASCPVRASVCLVSAIAPSTANAASRFFADFATGASGSEIVRVSDVFLGQQGIAYGTATLPPMSIPLPANRGDRISARVQSSSSATATRSLGFILYLG